MNQQQSETPILSETDDECETSPLTPSLRATLFHQKLFQLLDEDRRAQILKESVIWKVPENTILYRYGEKPKVLFFLLEGVVGLFAQHHTFSECLIEIRTQRKLFDEFSLFDCERHILETRTLSRATIINIPALPILEALTDRPLLRRYFLTTLSTQLRKTIRRLMHIKQLNAPRRIAAYLLEISGTKIGTGIDETNTAFPSNVDHKPISIVIDIGCKRSTLAKMLGMASGSFSRAFQSLATVGVHRENNQMIRISDLKALRLFVECQETPIENTSVEFFRRNNNANASPPPNNLGNEKSLTFQMLSNDGIESRLAGALTEQDWINIKKAPLFIELSQNQINRLLKNAQIIVYDPQTILFSQGDPAEAFYIVLMGQVQLSLFSRNGKKTIVETIDPGMSFGEAAIFENGKLPVTAECHTKTRVLRILACSVLNQIDSDPLFTQQLLDSLAHRRKQLIKHEMECKKHSPAQRLAAFLLNQIDDSIAPPTSIESASCKELVLTLTMTKTAIAERLDIVPESLSRIFVRLRRIGVTVRGNTIHIADYARLLQFYDSDADDPTQ
ncbi:CRP/FNR family transcriptional regulator, transcriptional activator FtrB [Azospirillaceae bacterium]